MRAKSEQTFHVTLVGNGFLPGRWGLVIFSMRILLSGLSCKSLSFEFTSSSENVEPLFICRYHRRAERRLTETVTATKAIQMPMIPLSFEAASKVRIGFLGVVVGDIGGGE